MSESEPRDTLPPDYSTMTEHEILVQVAHEIRAVRDQITHANERIDAIEKRLREGDERMGRIEANLGLSIEAAAVALARSGHEELAEKFRAKLDGLRSGPEPDREAKTDPGTPH